MEKIVTIGGKKATADYGRDKAEILTASKSLDANDTGKIFYLNAVAGFAITLPAVATAGLGWNCEIVIKTATTSVGYTVTELATSDTDVIVVNGINELEVDTSDDGVTSAGCTTITFVDSLDAVGDWIKIRCDGVKFYVTGQTSLDGGITAT